jgi:hypothetical protein
VNGFDLGFLTAATIFGAVWWGAHKALKKKVAEYQAYKDFSDKIHRTMATLIQKRDFVGGEVEAYMKVATFEGHEFWLTCGKSEKAND